MKTGSKITMIQNDSAYLKSSDITAAPKENSKDEMTYGGSTAYWMSELKTILIDGIGREELTDRIITSFFCMRKRIGTGILLMPAESSKM